MTAESTSMLTTVIMLLLMVVLLYFVMIRPQNKKEKKAQEMRNSIEVGDGIVTIGDMVKSIVSQHEKTIKQRESYIAGDLAAE